MLFCETKVLNSHVFLANVDPTGELFLDIRAVLVVSLHLSLLDFKLKSLLKRISAIWISRLATLFSKITFFCCSFLSSVRECRISEILWFLMELVDWARVWVSSLIFPKASWRFPVSFLASSILLFNCSIKLLHIRAICSTTLSFNVFTFPEENFSNSSFNALTRFMNVVFCSSYIFIRFRIYCISLASTSVSILILFKSLWTDIFAKISSEFDFCNSNWTGSNPSAT